MKVFISWSGSTAKAVAVGLRTLLQDVNYKIQPWMSETDLEAGTRWARDLAEQLQETNFGIICATRQSLESPWLLFEAGALSKSTATSRVCPYLIGLKPSLLTGPLSQFQSREATAAGTLSLLRAINGSMADNSLKEDQLERTFNRFWPDLEAILREVKVRSVLSPAQKREFVKWLLAMFPRREDLEVLFAFNDLPSELVNWNQAMLYVCNDVIDAVEQESKWTELIQAIREQRPHRPEILPFAALIAVQEDKAAGTSEQVTDAEGAEDAKDA